MPGITLVNYTSNSPFDERVEIEIIMIIHDIIEHYTGKRPTQSDIGQVSAGSRKSYVDYLIGNLVPSDADYFLIVDGQKNAKTKKNQAKIHREIKRRVVNLLDIDPAALKVRYRLFVSVFG